jgi:hypothetical protein
MAPVERLATGRSWAITFTNKAGRDARPGDELVGNRAKLTVSTFTRVRPHPSSAEIGWFNMARTFPSTTMLTPNG